MSSRRAKRLEHARARPGRSRSTGQLVLLAAAMLATVALVLYALTYVFME